MNIITTFTIHASDTTEIDILCDWRFQTLSMAASVTSGSYTFTISSRKGEPLLRLEKQDEPEPLLLIQIESSQKQSPKNEPIEINHFHAFEPEMWIYKYIRELFHNTALGFKISRLTGEDSISDVTIRVR